jgi:ABC-type microcin C transport system permease subunit YejB
MLRYIARRFLLRIPLLGGSSLISFLVIHLAPPSWIRWPRRR